SHRGEKAEPNNLLRFLMDIAPRTRSLLLATATPVQLDPIEAWDLLNALNEGQNGVLGSLYSRWRTRAQEGIDLVLAQEMPGKDLEVADLWEWMRDPLPPPEEGVNFQLLRRSLKVEPSESWAPPEAFHRLPKPDQQRVRRLSPHFFQGHNPFIRHIVRRTRDFLENTIDPQTNEPYLQRIEVRLFGESDAEAISLPPFLRDAYDAAEEFCTILARRPEFNSGFMKTILLRRVGSTIEAGRLTAQQMLSTDAESSEEEGEDDTQESPSSIYPLTDEERGALSRFLKILEENRDEDPKLRRVETILSEGASVNGSWLPLGCIIFSQFYDSVLWLGRHLSKRMPDEKIGVYASAPKSGIIENGLFRRLNRDEIKKRITSGELRLVIGTDAASEGLNLQRLGSLINLDLPWNPTRLEQRKGRIQRIGQLRPEVLIYNMRYKDSVEDRVHQLLSERLENIRNMFGQIPDTLEDVWVAAAMRDEEEAKRVIDAVPKRHPFEMRYDRIENVDWESCSQVLDAASQLEALQKGW
ncbi:MAG: helicase-related protein, partial [Deltaproteobacteria bacterium]|nr:helicase-related protein [Deltaproteobacteria bacterium]